MIEAARKEGIEVTIDQYPYTASSTSISTLIPDEILADGQDSIKARLQRPAIKKYVLRSMLARLKKRKLKHFSYAVVAYFSPDTTYNGKSIEQINLMKGRKHKAKAEAETVIDLMMAGGASALLSLPAVLGFEYGAGFGVASARGSENNDPYLPPPPGIHTATNRHGGMLGGISSGLPML